MGSLEGRVALVTGVSRDIPRVRFVLTRPRTH
jgi:hypothetical protein